MDDNEVERIAAAVIRQQAERDAQKNADAAAAAERASAEQADKDRLEAERMAPILAEQAAVAAEKDARLNAVLAAGAREVFVDPDGVEHKVAYRDNDKGQLHTVGTGHGGETIVGAYGRHRDNSKLTDWRKKD